MIIKGLSAVMHNRSTLGIDLAAYRHTAAEHTRAMRDFAFNAYRVGLKAYVTGMETTGAVFEAAEWGYDHIGGTAIGRGGARPGVQRIRRKRHGFVWLHYRN